MRKSAFMLMVPIVSILVLVCLERALGEDREKKTPPEKLRICVSKSLFNGMPEAVIASVLLPFSGLMEAQTGLKSDFVFSNDPFDLAQCLVDNKVQIGVVEGIEFAWMREKHAQLQPLVNSINQDRILRAYVMIRADARLDFTDLKNRSVAIPLHSRQHCRLFLERLCVDLGQARTEQYFSGIKYPQNAEDALDDLVDRSVDSVVIDAVSLDCYKRRKPGRFAHLKMIEKSEDFPVSVVVYCHGMFDQKTLHRFGDGLLSANKTPIGRQLLTLWKLTSFEAVPNDYERTLAEIVKSYPTTIVQSK